MREALAQSFGRVAPQALQLFRIAGDAVVRERVLSDNAEELRRRYRERINPVLQAADLEQI